MRVFVHVCEWVHVLCSCGGLGQFWGVGFLLHHVGLSALTWAW